MKITGTVEIVATGATARTEADSGSYTQGFQAMQRPLQEGTRLIAIRVER